MSLLSLRMGPAKIQLSEDELMLVQNAEILLTKNRIINTVYELFGEFSELLRERISSSPGIFPSEVLLASPKLSRGENYNGLPWVMLDYPRCFSRHSVCSLRTMFWWGNSFIITLHLKGIYQQAYAPMIIKNSQGLLGDFNISLGNNEWIHEINDDTYQSLSEMKPGDIAHKVLNDPFCKLAITVALPEWNGLIAKIPTIYGRLLDSIT